LFLRIRGKIKTVTTLPLSIFLIAGNYDEGFGMVRNAKAVGKGIQPGLYSFWNYSWYYVPQ